MLVIDRGWSKDHRFWRVLRNHRSVFGFWYARDWDGSEFCVTAFGRHLWLWRLPQGEA
jgi:hypothetical protein